MAAAGPVGAPRADAAAAVPALLGPPGLPGQTPPVTGTAVSGTVVNATQGGSVPAGLVVTATEVDATAARQIAVVSGTVGAGGSFLVGGLPGQISDRYAISTDYLGVTYVSEVKPPVPATLRIYETTDDNSNLSLPSATLTILTGKGQAFDALQLITVRNPGDRTYVGKPDTRGSGLLQTVELPVPPDISGFAPAQGVRGKVSVAADGQPVASDPILPGDTELSYAYTVNVARSGWPLSVPTVYPTARVELLVDPALNLSGPGLTYRQSILVGKKKYRNYQGGAMAPGTTLHATVTYVSNSSNALWISLALLLGLILGAAIGFPRLFRNRHRRGEEAEQAPEGESREALIEAIAALDERHEAGQIDEAEYQASREELKGRLVALTDAEAPAHQPAEAGAGTAEPGSEPSAGAEPAPAPVEPAPVEPAPVEPAPVEPAPAPVEPAPHLDPPPAGGEPAGTGPEPGPAEASGPPTHP